MAGRGWGPWTGIKLATLRDYLPQFTRASQKSSEVVYLDLFAGVPSNFDRTTGAPITGSPLLALGTHPRFTRLAFFELPEKVARLETELRARHPDRDFKVYADANAGIGQALADLHDVRWAPTFAFVDPDGPDCHWSTLQALARHKPEKAKSKVEIWLLFATMLNRQLPLDGRDPRDEDVDQITRMYGTDQWKLIWEARRHDEVDGAEARAEYVNLMRWRLEKILGYRATHPLDIPNERGVPIYTMIFATDHEAGDRIMSSLYRHAASAFPVMRVQAARLKAKQKSEASGQFSLLDGIEDDLTVDPAQLPLGSYVHEAPWTPAGTPDFGNY